MVGFKGVGGQFAFEQGVATGLSAGMCKETANQSKKECQQSAIKQENMTFEGYTQSLIGIIGGELLEKNLKKAFARQTAKITAKQSAKTAGKQTGKSIAKSGGKIGAKTGLVVTKLANRLIAKISVKLAAQITAKLAAKQAAMMATKIAAKAAMGPIGWALMVFDLISLGLDLWDPFGFNEILFNKDLRGIRDQFFVGYKDAIDNGALPDSYKNILRKHYHDVQNYELLKAKNIKEAEAKGEKWIDNDPDSIAKQPYYEDVKKMTYSSIDNMKNKDLPVSLGGPIIFPIPVKPIYPEYITISADVMADWYKTYNLTDVYSDEWYNSPTYKNWQEAITLATNNGTYIDRCLRASERKENSSIQLSPCDPTDQNQLFSYTNAGQYQLNDSNFCITKDANKILLKTCEQTRPMIGSTSENPLEMITNDYTQRWGISKNNQIFSLKKDDQLLYVTDDEYTPKIVRPDPPSKSSCVQFDSVVGKKKDDIINVSVGECDSTSVSQKFYQFGNQIQIEDNGSGIVLPDEYKKLRELLIGFNMTQQQFEQMYTSQLIKDPEVRQMWKSEIETYINNLFTEERIDRIVNQVLEKHGLEDMANIFEDDDLVLSDEEAAKAEDGENLGGGFVLATDETTGCRYKYNFQTDKSQFLSGPNGKNQQVKKISTDNKCPYSYDCVTGETKWGSPDGSETWVDMQDPTGKTYYYNCTSKQVSWYPNGIDPNLDIWIDGVDTTSKCLYKFNPSRNLTEIKKNSDGSDQIQILTNNNGCQYVYNCNTQESKWNSGEDQWVSVNHDPIYYLNCQTQEVSWYPNGIEPPQTSTNIQGPPPKITVDPPLKVTIKPTANELILPPTTETPSVIPKDVPLPIQSTVIDLEKLIPKEAIEVKNAERNFIPSQTPDQKNTKQEERSNNTKLIIGGVVGGLILIVSIIIIFIIIRSRRR
jgi:hypothetical protein